MVSDSEEVNTLAKIWQRGLVQGRRMVAQVAKKVPGGYLVRLDDSLAFVPNSFLDKELRTKPSLLIGRTFECEIHLSDGEHPPVVKPTGPFLPIEG